MFDSNKTKFLKALLKKIEDSFPITENMNFYSWYSFSFEWFNIYVETLMSWNIYNWALQKDWNYIADHRYDKWFFEEVYSILKYKKEKLEEEKEERRLAAKRAYEESMESVYAEYLTELEWIKIEKEEKWEMSPVFEDLKQVKYHTQEIKKIHDKYSKKFFWLF